MTSGLAIRTRRSAYVALTLLPLIWGSNWVVMQEALANAHPVARKFCAGFRRAALGNRLVGDALIAVGLEMVSLIAPRGSMSGEGALTGPAPLEGG